MAQRDEARGSTKGYNSWDDESNHDDVTKIYVRYSLKAIQSIRFDYVKNEEPVDGSIHGQSFYTFTQTFEINHLKLEHLESVEGYYTEDGGIQELQFKTNLRISEPMGYHEEGTQKFTISMKGKKIIGFHGSSTVDWIYSLGAYFNWVTPSRIEAKGGNGGNQWDDGVENEGFTKIHVRSGHEGIQYIKYEFIDKDGHVRSGPIHGSISGKGSPHLFEIKVVDNEYLVCVEGYYNNGVIQALQFITNIRKSELMGSSKECKRFRLEVNRMKIVGFHGSAEQNLNSLGAYFTTITPTKSGWPSSITPGGFLWDDGAFDGVIKVSVFYGGYDILCLRFYYDNKGKVEIRDHGIQDGYPGQKGEFVVDYPNEFITSVVGTCIPAHFSSITSLTFKTSKGRTSQKFGKSCSTSVDFVVENKDFAIVGFHGWGFCSVLTALGAYFYPMPPPCAAEKLEAQGGNGGAFWDDGSNFGGIRKICIGIGKIGIASIKFLYENDTNELVVGDHHGNKTLVRYEEFELNHPSEYLISVEGSHDLVPGSDEFEVILMLKFKTNIRTSPCFGLDDDSSFVLHKEGHKIVGFHGKSDNMLHQIGVHVLPITCP